MSWLFSFIVFIFVSFSIFTVPGLVILGRRIMPWWIRYTLSSIIGVALWTWQGYLLGLLHLRFLTYVYVLICLYIFSGRFLALRLVNFSKIFQTIKKNFLIIFIFSVGVIAQQ